MSTAQHARRLGPLVLGAVALLSWLVGHTDVFFADGLRYITQAKAISHGSWAQGVVRSVDHPLYPMAIAVVHGVLKGDSPHDWQIAAQAAAAIAGVLLVIPVYLVSYELFGAPAAWLAVFLTYLLPFSGHVLADTLSESTFLLFWTWGVWTTLRFLRAGALGWIPLTICFSVLAYLTRPEGLILPAALLATLVVLPYFQSSGLPVARRRWAIGILVLGPMLLAGPFILAKGNISTKPSMLRILGIGRAAPAMAVERERPLPPDQTLPKTVYLAVRAMMRSVEGATSLPLILLAPLGIAASWPSNLGRRHWIFLGSIITLSTAAMVRLHAMSGYCTPRHAMIVGWILIPASAAGLDKVVTAIALAIQKRMAGAPSRARLEMGIKAVALGVCATLWGPATLASIDPGFHGYKQAGEWLATAAEPGESMVDPKGFSLFYADRHGYTFSTLEQATRDRSVRWIIAHEALIYGPWDYSKCIRELVAERKPVRIFPAKPAHRVSKVYVYDLAQPVGIATSDGSPVSPLRR